MIKQDILNMRSGNDLDALIAEKIFYYKHYIGNEVPKEHYCSSARGNQEVWLSDKEDRYCRWCGDMPSYSEYIGDAIKVVEQVQKLKPFWRFSMLGGDVEFGKCFKVEWFGEEDPNIDYGDRHGSCVAYTPSEAICKASLIAILGLA